MNPHRNIIKSVTGSGALFEDVVNGLSIEVLNPFFAPGYWFMYGNPIVGSIADGANFYVGMILLYSNVVSTHFSWNLRKIAGYKVVADASISVWNTAINAALDEGWTPAQPIFVDTLNDKYTLVMVKYEGVVVV